LTEGSWPVSAGALQEPQTVAAAKHRDESRQTVDIEAGERAMGDSCAKKNVVSIRRPKIPYRAVPPNDYDNYHTAIQLVTVQAAIVIRFMVQVVPRPQSIITMLKVIVTIH